MVPFSKEIDDNVSDFSDDEDPDTMDVPMPSDLAIPGVYYIDIM